MTPFVTFTFLLVRLLCRRFYQLKKIKEKKKKEGKKQTNRNTTSKGMGNMELKEATVW